MAKCVSSWMLVASFDRSALKYKLLLRPTEKERNRKCQTISFPAKNLKKIPVRTEITKEKKNYICEDWCLKTGNALEK